MRVLHVDDDPMARELVKIGMERYGGHEVRSFDGGSAAMDYLRTETVDLIVCDVMMAGMNGAQFIRTIRREALSNAPVMFLTSGFDAGADMLDALEPLAILSKPFNPFELAGDIQQRMGQGDCAV